MESRWSDQEAQKYLEKYAPEYGGDVALRVYSSRLIGSDPSLVLHGGGNTSVKTRRRDDTGAEVDVLCVKGSGWDLGDIEPEGLPAVRLESLLELRGRDSLSDEEMVNAQRTRLLDASAPNPSVETLLHAFLPHKYIDHSHADAILSLVDQPDAARLCHEQFGDRFGVVPYIMPGFALSKLAAEVYERDPSVEGLLLLQHGLFTFGDTAQQSYERHIAAVGAADAYARKRRYWAARPSMPPMAPVPYSVLAPVLRGLLGEGKRRYLLHMRGGGEIRDFVDDAQVAELSQVGVATPDHVIRTKPLPLLLRVNSSGSEEDGLEALTERVRKALEDYREQYRDYVKRQIADKQVTVTPLDPDPRVILVPGIGLISAGTSEKAASVAADLYEHTISVIRNAEAIDRYQALPEGDIFDMEYWSLEQAKLGKKKAQRLQARVVYVTGAASGIGAATARCFHDAGASLFLVDRDEQGLQELAQELDASYGVVDVCDEMAVHASIEEAVEIFGGLDGVISNAGTAPQGRIDEVSQEQLLQSFQVNFFSHQAVAAAAVRVMKRQGMGGFLLFNASKAAFNPGAGFGPYALPKAALVALMKQYALEVGEHGIRSNAINADRIRSGLLDEGMVAERARLRGLTADDYYRSNLLKREVSAQDVAEAFLSLALSPSTTGAVLTVDGGNIAASPR